MRDRYGLPVGLRPGRRLPDKCLGLAAGPCDRPRALRSIGPPPPVPRGRTCTARIAPTCTVLPPPPERFAAHLTFVTALASPQPPPSPYAQRQPGLCASRVRPTHPRLSRGRACTSRIAQTCIALLRPSAGQPDAANFCNGAASAPASMFCMRLCPGSRTDLPALPDSSPAPRSEPHCNILPPYCSAAGPGSETRQPEPLASHALLHGVRSCTSSPD